MEQNYSRENRSAQSSHLTVDSVTQVEQHGIDVIPETDRNSKPRDLFFVFVGSQMCFGIIVIGSLPIVFGLGFWDSVSSITLGLIVGSLFFSLLTPLGAKTGCSGAVASGAHFGVRGRVIGTLLAIFTGLGFYGLTVWTGGEAISAVGAKLVGWEMSKNLMAAGAAVICLLTIIAAVYGHAMIVATEKLVSYGVAIILVLTGFALISSFDPSYAGGTYLLKTFWPTWFLSTAVNAALPVSYAIFLNDYTRYLPKHSDTKTINWASGGGMFVGCWITLVFAAAVTTMFKSATDPFVTSLINMSPVWAVILLGIVGLIGSQPQGSLCLYGAGLGLQSIFPGLNRVVSTVILSLIGLGLVFAGIYWMDMSQMIIAFLVLDHSAIAPWLAINVVGYYFIKQGSYEPAKLFQENGGPYWYSNGWNLNAVGAWIAGLFAGMLFTHTDIYSGPLAEMTGGGSLDWLAAAATAGLIYYSLERRRAAHAGIKAA